MSSPASTPLSVYIHWPFCAAKCPYCDFNSHVRHQPVDRGGFADGLIAEIAHYARLAPGRRVETVFFGGGTPSLMAPADVGRILDKIAGHWPCAADLEVTLEANPTSVDVASFQQFRMAGVNRLSLGVQALDDRALKALGRLHDTRAALAALDISRATFPAFSFDLIYARPGQSAADWADELTRALELAGDHLSLYQLTIEPGTPFFERQRNGQLIVPEEAEAADLFALTGALCAEHGLPLYEISNHARPGAECRHNLCYWRCGDYLPIGPGAHGRLTREGVRLAIENEPHPEKWLHAVKNGGHGARLREHLDLAAMRDEYLLMGMRRAKGICLRRLASEFRCRLDPSLIDELADDGLVNMDGERLRTTPSGRLVLNLIVSRLAGAQAAAA